MAKLSQGQVRIQAERNKLTGEIAFKLSHANDVAPADAQWLYEQLTFFRETLLTRLNAENPLEEPFLPAWAGRGFNPASIRFSIYTLSAARPRPKRYRVPVQCPGVLYARWAREQHDSTPDLICSWQWPCTRRDMRFFHAFFSIPITGTGWSNHKTIWEEFAEHGFDRETLRFEVRHASPMVIEM